MAIDLLNSFLQKGQSVAAQAKSDSTHKTTQAPQNMQIMRAIRALQAGQTIQGEVLSVKGDEVQLAVLNQMILDARLEQSMNLTPGTLMAFQIKSNNSAGLSLMPLFTNTAVDPNAMKALDMAGIPLNDRTLEMVQTLMQRGLPIDRQSLQEVYRELVAFKDARPADIISLRQMNMPVTAENLQQLSLYENNQHFLSDTFTEIGKSLENQLADWIQSGDLQTARTFLGQLRQIFGEVIQKEQPLQTAPPVQEEGKTTLPQTEGKEVPVQTLAEEIPVPEKNMVISEKAFIQNENIIKEEPQSPTQDRTAEGKEPTVLQNNSWDRLLNLLSQPRSASKTVAAFHKLWEQEIKPQLMLEPEQVMEKEKVQEFYERLSRQVQQLESLANEHTGSAAPLAKAVQNTAANLDFMNQMNQLHAYIQLPLKLANQEAKGELYVFTNKRSMAREEGRVTALLHLDMEHLGSMDIFVALENQKVSTQFYLEREEYLNFLEQHMDKLTSRLNKRGYECSMKTCLRQEGEERSVVERIITGQSQPVLLSTQAFDMRA